MCPPLPRFSLLGEVSSGSFESIGLSPIQITEVVLALEDEFAIDIPDAAANKLASIEDLVTLIESTPAAK